MMNDSHTSLAGEMEATSSPFELSRPMHAFWSLWSSAQLLRPTLRRAFPQAEAAIYGYMLVNLRSAVFSKDKIQSKSIGSENEQLYYIILRELDRRGMNAALLSAFRTRQIISLLQKEHVDLYRAHRIVKAILNEPGNGGCRLSLNQAYEACLGKDDHGQVARTKLETIWRKYKTESHIIFAFFSTFKEGPADFWRSPTKPVLSGVKRDFLQFLVASEKARIALGEWSKLPAQGSPMRSFVNDDAQPYEVAIKDLAQPLLHEICRRTVQPEADAGAPN